ncbi:MAG: hypothetical protein JWO74_3556 [Solirubrobacterales bacterium]|jgi:hypothetical protein|nr:hypothetical protein [Solirubrobacterales bacterium]
MVAAPCILTRVDLVDEVVALPSRDVRLLRPRDAEAPLSDDAADRFLALAEERCRVDVVAQEGAVSVRRLRASR